MLKKLLNVFIVVCLVSISYAWQTSSTGTFIAETTRFDSQSYSLLSCGSGETIIAWQDGRGDYWNIFAQKLNSEGSTLWNSTGVAISTSAGDQYYPVMTGDGAGGAIIAWFDCRYTNSSDVTEIFAQRIDTNGNVLWAENGLAICTVTNDQSNPVITSDGVGGAIICWHDKRNGNYDIYAQRVNGDGAVLWAESGVAVNTSDDTQWWPTIASDGNNGAIIAWTDNRHFSTSSSDIYTQRIDGNGNLLWSETGVAVCIAVDDQSSVVMASDDAGGVILSWPDKRSGNYDVYAQRVNSVGSTLWTSDGVPICTAEHEQPSPVITSDGANGAIIAWGDKRLDPGNFLNNVYAQRVNGEGSTLWTLDGVAICTVAYQNSPVITGDGNGGAIIGWYDARGDNDLDIYAQKINSSGVLIWVTDGIPVCMGNSYQWYPVITSDGNGGAVFAWLDMTGSWPYNIRMQQVDGGGIVPVELSQFEVIY